MSERRVPTSGRESHEDKRRGAVSKRVTTAATKATRDAHYTPRPRGKNTSRPRRDVTSSHRRIAVAALALSLTIVIVQAAADVNYAEGHGTGSESFPPTDLNGRQVTLEVSSSAPPPPETTGRPPSGIKPGEDLQIGVALIDFDTKVTLRDVTFAIRAERGDKLLFEQEFEADGGFLVFNFVSDDSAESVTVSDRGSADGPPDVFAYLLGTESRTVDVTGPKLADGGLYRFGISILTADGYDERLIEPLTYDSGISIPQIITYGVDDPNFGDQYIRVITYYDEIGNFEFDSESREIRFSMPFEWSDENLNQSYVVHEEISIPDTYGDMLVSGFEISINGVTLPDDVVIIDDFFIGERIVHFIIPQERLYDVRAASVDVAASADVMDFVIKPDEPERIRMASVTENGQFRVFATWEPENLKSGQNAKIVFEIADVFLKNAPVEEEYTFTMTTKDGKIIFEESGTSSGSRNGHADAAEFVMPPDVSGVAYLNFESISGNERARTSIPIVVDRITGKATIYDETIGGVETPDAPDKNDAGDGTGGCLIATAVFGSELAPQVQHLREIRDGTMLRTESGAAFMSAFNAIYYSFSPAVSDMQRENPILREATRAMLTPMIASLMLLDRVSIETEEDAIVYGLSIIALNALMYVGLPTAVVIMAVKAASKARCDAVAYRISKRP